MAANANNSSIVSAADVRGLARRTRNVDGWFSADAASLFALLDSAQKEHDVRGDLFEIGVHHGKSALLLAALTRPEERLGVCDVFDAGQNVSVSGAGNRAAFMHTMHTHAPQVIGRLDIHACLSSALTTDSLGGPYRIFHVDGGHLAEEAFTDIALAAAVSDARGVVVVDDPFRVEWPGVTEALLRFCGERADWSVLAVGFNKLVLVPSHARALYEAVLTPSAVRAYIDPRIWTTKVLPVAGHPATLFFIPSYRRVPSLDERVAYARSRWSALTARLRRT